MLCKRNEQQDRIAFLIHFPTIALYLIVIHAASVGLDDFEVRLPSAINGGLIFLTLITIFANVTHCSKSLQLDDVDVTCHPLH